MLIPPICSGNASNHPHFIGVAMPGNMGWINETSKMDRAWKVMSVHLRRCRVVICAAGDGGRQ
jgi:hypothetical protein